MMTRMFRAAFADPHDHLAALRAARQLAAACHLRRCTVQCESHALASAVADQRPIALAIAMSTVDAFAVPTVLLHGAPRSVALEVARAQGDAISVRGADFARRAPELAALPGASFSLTAEVDAADSRALLAELSPTTWSSYTFAAALDNDELFTTILACAASTSAAVTLRWDDADGEIWIPFVGRDGHPVDDGRIDRITLTVAPTGCQLILVTALERCGTTNAATWLAERAGVPIVYHYPS